MAKDKTKKDKDKKPAAKAEAEDSGAAASTEDSSAPESTEELLGDTLFSDGQDDGQDDLAAQGTQAQAPQGAQLALMAQYVKDLSFENPNAPQVFGQNGPPQIDVSVDVVARQVSEDQYESELKFSIRASHDKNTDFVAELVYAGLFGLRGIPPEHVQAVCLIECPRLLFPFARRILADATRDGGFPPLLLDPIDFAGLYQQRLEAAQQAAEGGANGGANGGGGGGGGGDGSAPAG